MTEKYIRDLLLQIKADKIGVEEALKILKKLPYEKLDFATIDHHRAIRKGFPEVIWGRGKSVDQILEILEKMREMGGNLLITKLDRKKVGPIKKLFPEARYYPLSQILTIVKEEIPITGKGTILVITAGTSDIAVAEEALVTAEIMGNKVDYIYDVGVAGIHRLLSHMERLNSAHVVIVAAGMEGALPSVIGGLVAKPIIAVPTSSGYGTSLGGIAALLAMLNSCSGGIGVVNIDNGFGAGHLASLINHL